MSEIVDGLSDKSTWRTVCKVLLAGVSSWACARCLNADAEVVAWICLFALEFIALNRLKPKNLAVRKPLLRVVFLFTLAFAVSLILGDHIVVPASGGYNAHVDESYIAPYHLRDLALFAMLLPGLFALFAAPVQLLQAKRESQRNGILEPCMDCLGVRWVLLLSAIVFLGWVPYMVIYWPGFVFGDSLSSLSQAMGWTALSNHHPVAYTIYLKCWLKFASVLGFDSTVGVGLSSIFQSVLMSLGFGLLARWVVVRGGIRPVVGIAIALVFSMTPYIATYGIALWKDPLFSSAVVIFSICLADYVWSKGEIAQNRSWIALLLASSLVMVFFRNNGVYILLGVLALLVIFLIAKSRLRYAKGSCRVVGCMAAVLLAFGIVTGPFCSFGGVVPSEASESVGIPLNQMARVVALDGDMSESDREYMNSIYPLEEYKSTYTPCCTDNLKWAAGFNNSVLNEGLWGHWASMLVRNPNAYFQAWELQTYGFWAVNPGNSDRLWSWNINGGVPRNANAAYVDQLVPYGIESNPAALDESWNEMLPMDSWSVPISWLFWTVLYLSICLLAAGKGRWVFALIPSIILVATLAIASPIYYWPRYGAALQFLIPMYVLVFFLLFGKKKRTFR